MKTGKTRKNPKMTNPQPKAVIKCILKANSKVVHFDPTGISLQDSQGSPPITWIHHFRDGNNTKYLVTFTQKSGNEFKVMKKVRDKLELIPFGQNDEEPNFNKHGCGKRSLLFECHGAANRKHYLYAKEKLSVQHRREDDPPNGQHYFFQLENISN
ncbi:uncharacterized protein LOC143841144 isoform X2 [Paroedura picta]|uniref:uncharacterized protein LOC143841144 isoform X2 n=1 Tax=Paroedura picta TaxID=143630 RepID=UPI0040567B3A